MMYTYPTQTTFIYLVFSFTFFSSTCFFSIPIKYLFFSSTHHLVSSITHLFHLKLKDSSSCSPKRQEERDTLHSKWEKKKPQQKRKKLAVEEEEAHCNSGFMGLCWNWKLHIWFRILQSVWLVRIWRKGKERRIWGRE